MFSFEIKLIDDDDDVQQITYLFEKCKHCITKVIPFTEHNFGPFGHIFFVVVLFDSQSKTLFPVLFSSL